MADTLRLRVVLDLAERVVNPMKRIRSGSSDAAKAIQATKDRLKELNQQQAMVNQFGPMKRELADTAAKLATAQAKVAELSKAYGQAGPPTRAMARELASAKKAATALATAHDGQQVKLQQLRERLNAAGISTRELSSHSRRLKADIGAANASIDAQTSKLKAASEQHKKLQALNAQHAKAMLHTGMVGGVGMAMQAAGRRGVEVGMAPVTRFAEQENAATQLRASLMQADGSVPQELQKITDLAINLGNRLPGSTADFLEMMTMLRRQGMSAQSILGGLGESAAYLGVQLKMPVTAAAEFTAKMQDATQTTEKDMMSLMDVIQRAYYLGVDPTNMLQGFKNVGAVMPFLGSKGLEASRQLSPLLVMMDQVGMAGESAGNAIRKVVQLSLDSEKLAKANKLLKADGVQLRFATSQGKFAGLENLFAQLDKLKGIKSDVKRIAAMKKLFGDDAETHQVLNTLMEKGQSGYRDVLVKLQAQADLKQRVNEQLGTFENVLDAAKGVGTNVLAEIGKTLAPDLKRLIQWLGDTGEKIGAWVQAHSALVGWTMKLALGLALLITAMGMVLVPAALLVGKLLLMRFLWMRLGMAFGMAGAGSRVVAAGLGLLGRAASGAWAVLAWVARGLMALGSFMLANPIVAALALVATAAFLLWRNWDGVKGGLLIIWQQLSDAVARWWGSTTAGAQALWADLVALKDRFFSVGSDLIGGLINGITSRWGALKSSVVETANAVSGWFKERLGINSPSRVFMQYGGWISDGAALGMLGGQGAVRSAALAMAAAAAGAMPLAADAGALAIDTRPALTTGMQGRMGGGAMQAPVYHITINAAPGMDARDLAKAVSAELDRRDRAGRSRVLSSLSDID